MRGAEHPVQCPICHACWDFSTDELGRLVAIHPVTKCVPPPAPEIETEDESEAERRCEECHKLFRPKRSARVQVVCGSVCRSVRRDRQQKRAEKRRGKWWKGRAKKKGPRICVQCLKPFTQANKYAAKQVLCSAECRMARDAALRAA